LLLLNSCFLFAFLKRQQREVGVKKLLHLASSTLSRNKQQLNLAFTFLLFISSAKKRPLQFLYKLLQPKRYQHFPILVLAPEQT